LVQAFTVLLIFYFSNLTLTTFGSLLGYKYLADPAAFPFFLLIISAVSLVMTPILNWYSRQLETNADKVAIHLTDNPEAFISMMTKLADQNLAVASPKRWVEIMFYDHPPVMKRISLARDYMQEREMEGKH
jgi:STE24 endopeptidase